MEGSRQRLGAVWHDNNSEKGWRRMEQELRLQIQKTSCFFCENPGHSRRKTSIGDANLCEAQITVTLKNGAFTIRKTHADGPNHTHDLKTSDLRKRPSEVTEFIEAEA